MQTVHRSYGRENQRRNGEELFGYKGGALDKFAMLYHCDLIGHML